MDEQLLGITWSIEIRKRSSKNESMMIVNIF